MDSGDFSEVETRDICSEQIFFKMDHTKSASAESMLPSTVSALGGSGFSALAVSSDGMTVAAATDDFINVYPISSIWLPSMSFNIPTGLSDTNFEVQNGVCNRADCDSISSAPYTGVACERASRSHSKHHAKTEGAVHSMYFHGDEDEYLIGIGPTMLLLYDLMGASLDPLIALDMRCFGMYSDDSDEASEQSVSVLRINRNTAFCKGYEKLLSSIELVVSVKPYIPTFYRVLFNEIEDWSIIDCNSTCPIIPQESIDDDVPYFLYNHNHHFTNESWASSDAHSDSESDSTKVRKTEDDLSDTQEEGEIENGSNDAASQISSSGAPYENIDGFKETKEDSLNDTIDGNFFYPFTLLEELLKYDDDDILDAVKQNIRMDRISGHDRGTSSSHMDSKSLKFSDIILDKDGLSNDPSGSADKIKTGIHADKGSSDSCNNPNNPHSCDCLCPSGTLNLEFNEEFLYSSMVPMSSLVLIKLTLLNNYSIRWCGKEPYIYSRTSSVLNTVILSDLELITQGGYVHSIISRDCDNMFTVISSDRFFLLRYMPTLPETTDDPPSCSNGSSSLSFPSEKLETGTEIPLDVNKGGRSMSNCDKISKLDSQGVTRLVERNKKNTTLQEKSMLQVGQNGGDEMSPSMLEGISDNTYRISYNDDQLVYDLEIQYTHYDPVLKVRYCAGCFNKYSDDGYFVIGTNYASHFRLHFFDLVSQSSVDAVRLILDVSKCKGFTSIAWISGNKLVGLTKLNGELYLLEPKFKRNWVGLVPNFNYIDSNVELIEEEDIFDDSEGDETICVKPSPKENNAPRRPSVCNKLRRKRRRMSNYGTISEVKGTSGCSKVYTTPLERLSQIVSNRGYRRKIYNKIYNYGSGIDNIEKYPFYHIGFSVTGGEWPSFHDNRSADKLSDESIIQHNDDQDLLKLYHQKVNYTK